MHEALVALGVVADVEAAQNAGWAAWLGELAEAGRATRLGCRDATGASAACGSPPSGWRRFATSIPVRRCSRRSTPPAEYAEGFATRDEALRELLRARLGGLGPMHGRDARAPLGLPRADVELGAARAAVAKAPSCRAASRRAAAGADAEWCERHLLARIHRYTLEAAAARDRAGRAARLRALPVRLAARRRGEPRQRPRRAGRRARASSKATRRRRRVGGRDPAGARPGLSPARGSTTCAPRAARSGRGCARCRATAARGGSVAALDADPAAAAPRRAALVARWRRRAATTPTSSARARGWSPRISPTHGASFFDEIADAVRLLPPRSRTRSPSWSCAAASTATASPACARCSCRRRSALRRTRAAARRRRCSASPTPDAGR